jgi:hypothetical protein
MLICGTGIPACLKVAFIKPSGRGFSIGGFRFEVQKSNPEGCQKVAGGRSEAKTTG